MSRCRNDFDRPSGAWVSFSYIAFASSLVLVGGGIVGLPLPWELRLCLAVGFAIVAGSSAMFGLNMASRADPIADAQR